MSSKKKEIAAVIAAILVNAVILSQLVGGVGANGPTTAFAQPYSAGETCDPTLPDQCVSGLICSVQGVCVQPLTAPSLSWPGQFLAATLLTLLGWFGMKRMRREG